MSIFILYGFFSDFSGVLMWGREVAIDDLAIITGFAIFLSFHLLLWGLNKANTVSRHLCISRVDEGPAVAESASLWWGS